MPIARFPSFVFDCPDAADLARFYGELLGWRAEVALAEGLDRMLG